MNITVIRLVIVVTSTGFVVMCKILTVVVAFFECARVNSTFLGCDSLPLVLITYQHKAHQMQQVLEQKRFNRPLNRVTNVKNRLLRIN